MPAVELSEQTYHEAERLATERGMSVGAYLDDLIREDTELAFDAKAFFTPERLAEINTAVGRARNGGQTFTSEEVREYFEQKHRDWCAQEVS